MKTKIEIKKIEFAFDINAERYTVRWLYLGKKLLNCINYKNWRVMVIIYNDNNRVCDITYETTHQPNLTNSIDYLKRILERNK